ncbi:maintenance of telomere capping protein 1 [Lentinula aciculospora]|uniref:Maintenance of telomere capping protein 1 n=1 Tax=Lentinula aciculospora TaxID=153920 RepID=A0A9W9DLY9_9AGAR|nr:maintenance of telomere capping protein 1 [Lentinula aciculospora]
MSSSKSKTKQEEALQLLDDLDSFTPIESVAPSGSATAPAPESETEVLAFLDEITQKSSEPTRPTTAYLERPASRTGVSTLRKSTERVKLGGSSLSAGASTSPSRSGTPPTAYRTSSEPASESTISPAAGSWGWGSVWTTASAALQQARTVVDEQVKNLPNNEQAKKWSEGVKEYAKTHQLDKLGQDFKRVGLSTLTDILNVVAPPISEHEVIQIWLSHDMNGYDGVENLVFRAMTRVLEQVEGGELIVDRGEQSRPKDDAGSAARDLNTVEGYEAAVKLSQANLDELIKIKDSALKAKVEKSSTLQSPTSYSYLYLRVQPYFTSYSVPSISALASTDGSAPSEQSKQQHLQFLLYLSDPDHNLIHSTITQAVPGAWLGIWDDYEWVEDLVAEALRVGVEVIGQEYLVSRMGWGVLNVKEKIGEKEEQNGEKEEES